MIEFKMTPRFRALAINYPRLFPQIDNPNQPIIELQNEGWFKLVEDTLFLLNRETECMPEDICDGIVVHQIKTKFGGLRIHLNQTTPFLRGVIAMAEQTSYSICEHCGLKGDIRNIRGWVATLCEEHFLKEKHRIEDTLKKNS